MIVMKFGGASLASPASIRRVAELVRSELPRNPVIVVSAIAETTDRLLRVLEHASRAESYLAWKLQEDLRNYHFLVAEDLLSPKRLGAIDSLIRQTFRDLHVRMVEVCEGERNVTPELHDWVAALGEELSSRIVAAALEDRDIAAMHLDAKTLILTDDRFTAATPRYWETYARIRWSIPLAARSRAVVLGGFIGATEDGRTTTLGRGGSDLTATIVGAAINADEVQVWKDVDGMLTWDPKIKTAGYCLKNLSYEEARDLAQAGATILHPETMAPAQRLRIPVVIRNTFRPDGEGTRIGLGKAGCSHPVKSIACKTNVSVIELRSPIADGTISEYSPVVERICQERKAVTLLGMSEDVIYLGVDQNSSDLGLNLAPGKCLKVYLRTGQSIITLVGQGLKTCTVAVRLSGLLNRNRCCCCRRPRTPARSVWWFLKRA